ncbi:MAG TPA: 3-hydroxyacyl-CoA dehydrogenase NAD-binding domain-containing protein, partial [Anaerolineales bacterium]|nr:3-hydroxyacyl-CoA dehydrogenase NAD-binding domain-containing protein [Anaerolineales bacterium]
MDVNKILVVGAGTMGNGIAQTASISGYDVTMTDISPEILEQATATIAKSVEKLAAKGVIDEGQKDAALQIATAPGLEAAREADLVVEAATENPELKLKLFADLDIIAPEKTILASNTSSISLTKIGAATNRPDKVIGMHFFNPVPLMKLLEVVRGLATSGETT